MGEIFVSDLISMISPTRKRINREIRTLVPELNRGGVKILEVGCGKHSRKKLFPLTNWLATDVKRHEGVDAIADVTRLQFKSNSFDVVFCIAVLEHVFECRKAVKEIHRVLKPNGSLILSVPFLYPIHDPPNDYWRFTEFGLRELLSGFLVTEVKSLGFLWKRMPLSYFAKARKGKNENGGFICVICGKATNSPNGFMRHPICQKCFKDKKKREEWKRQLKIVHPELLEVGD